MEILKRWVEYDSIKHMVYERDGKYSRTRCGKMVVDGNHTQTTIARAGGNSCTECVRVFEKMRVDTGEGEPVSKRPMKVSGRRRKSPNSGYEH